MGRRRPAHKGMTNTSGVPHRGSFQTCVLVGACLLAGCVDTIEADADERELIALPSALFDPQRGTIPLPNNLLVDPRSGRVTVPAACGEQPDSPAAQLRASLNQLDGFGTAGVNLSAPFNVALDAASLEERVFVLRLAERGEPLSGPERVEVDLATVESERLGPDCSTSSTVHALLIRPRAPLAQSSTYAVVLLSGILSDEGETVQPSASWALVRQSTPPVQFDDESGSGRIVRNDTPFDPRSREGLQSLQGLDRLWRGHAPLLSAWDQIGPALTGSEASRDDVLIAWGFTTQTLSDPLDPRVPDSPAALLAMVSDELRVPAPIAGEGAALSVEEFFATALPGTPCSALGCDAIGWIYADTAASASPSFVSPSYLEGDDCDTPSASPSGAFDDPLRPSFVCDRRISLLTVVPRMEPGPEGYPVAVFAHGLGRSKEDLLAIAGSLASAGILSVAFDAADHGARAVQISDDPELGCSAGDGPCADAFGPTCAPQCFAPLLSANLAVTRDHLRQTLLDQRQLERVLGACRDGACGRIAIDPARIGYIGHALGALLGGVAVATSERLSGAVLNEAAGDWVGVLSDTATDAIRCPLVDSLIAGGVLEGTPWDGGAASDATCLGQDWKRDPRFLEFAAAARWLLDPVDPLNYAARLAAAAPPVLLGEIEGDPVIPNTASEALASLIGLDPEPASVATAPPIAPTPGALAEGNVRIRYSGVPADADSGFPGNAYGPGSLLAPAPPAPDMADPAGQLGTAQLRVDAITFLGSRRR
jgi:hypothetical protein